MKEWGGGAIRTYEGCRSGEEELSVPMKGARVRRGIGELSVPMKGARVRRGRKGGGCC